MPGQSTSARLYKMNAGTASAGRVRSKSRKVRKEKSKSKQIAQRIPQVDKRVLFIIGTVLFFFFVILAQNYVITQNDQSILSLRDELKTITEANDSKNGKILKMQDLSELGKKAESYGMVKPGPEQYVYVVVDNPADTSNTETAK